MRASCALGPRALGESTRSTDVAWSHFALISMGSGTKHCKHSKQERRKRTNAPKNEPKRRDDSRRPDRTCLQVDPCQIIGESCFQNLHRRYGRLVATDS